MIEKKKETFNKRNLGNALCHASQVAYSRGWKVLEFFVKINDLALFISDLEYSGFDWKV